MNDYGDYEEYQTPPAHNGMETAAVILGILGIIGSMCCYLALPMGALGVLLAILSKGKQERMSSRAKMGLGLSLAGVVLSVVLTAAAFYQYRDVISSPDFKEKMKEYLEYYNRNQETEDIDDFLEDFFRDKNGQAGGAEGYQQPEEVSPYDGVSPYEGTNPYGGTYPYGGTDPYSGSYPYGGTPYGGGNSGGSVLEAGPEI